MLPTTGLTLLLGVTSGPATHLGWRLEWRPGLGLGPCCLRTRGEAAVLRLSSSPDLQEYLGLVTGLAYSLTLTQLASDLPTGTWVKLARVS